ncbi:FxSxx-COOH system tetratricopeptide repeat protein [Streptomyces dysideae]|uniref:ATP-binding protein n=1 Tax=Streptomyces dysideae TaxID=909626 RepID=A0A117RZA0_9ACTN|nr:FxSxx-COOH system tetratricopeptide repeat protein [Streptomyces dysideae]KUO16984.1 ATP-binding protein [Streptomyces dysideae]
MTGAAQRFFISYAGVDRLWAEWVGWHLEQDGHRVHLDVWDWQTGDDFVKRMDEGLEEPDAVVAVFSPAYFEPGRWTQEERSAVVARRDRLIPLAIEPLTNNDVPATLAAKVRTNLHGLGEADAVEALRRAVGGGGRPTVPPAFPGAPAPGAAALPDSPKPPLPGDAGEPEVWNVRRRNRDFSGREAQIVQLRDGLLSGRHSVVYALHGMGGIGKTQIALEYAHRFAGQYDLVWWVDAEQADQIPVRYGELADRIGIAVAEAGAEHNARMLLQHLRKRSRWLIILDNAEDPDPVERWLPEGPGHVLITSRNPNWRRLARPTALDVFTRADSLAYLRSRVPGIAEEQAETLAKELGDLPLALAQAAGVIENGMTVERYRRLLNDSTGRILREGGVPDYPAPLAAAVGIATEGLGDAHPDAAALLRLAAFLGPEPIPTEWLETARPRLSTIPGDPEDLMRTRAALEPLRRYGLARIDGEAFQIHRLTQAVVRDNVDPGQAEAIHDDVAAIVAAVEPGDPYSPGNWPAWASLTSHLVSQHIDPTHRAELRPMLRDAVHFLIRSGQPRIAAEVAVTLRDAWTAQLGPDHPDVLTCTQYLGHATSDLGDMRGARPIIEDAFTRRRRTLGDDHPDTLQSANDLAAILGNLGDREEPLRGARDTLARRRRVLGDDHLDTLRSASNLAMSLSMTGEHVASRALDEDTLARRRRVLGDDHPDTLQSAINLGDTLTELGETAEALRLHEETRARCRSTLGDDHPITLSSAQNLAGTLHKTGKYREARELLEDTLARRRRVLGEDHPNTLRTMQSLAVNLSNLGNVVESRRLLEDSCARRRRILGEDHPATLQGTHELAVALHRLREFEQARRVLDDTVARRRRVLGEDDPATLSSAQHLAVTMCKLRSLPAGVALLEDVRARQLRTLGVDHEDTQTTTRSLIAAYKELGLHRKAQKLTPKKATKRRFGRKGR